MTADTGEEAPSEDEWGRVDGFVVPTGLWHFQARASPQGALLDLAVRCVPQGVQTACDPALAKVGMSLGVDLGEDEDPIWSWGHIGAHLQPSARLLGRYLLSEPGMDLVRGKTVLELGCGVGLMGPVALMAGAKKVVLTDFDPVVLSLCMHNQARNRATLIGCLGPVVEGAVSVVALDWREGIRGLGDDHIDVVLATDVVYDEGLSAALRDVILALTARHPDTTVLLAAQHRQGLDPGSSDSHVEEWIHNFSAAAGRMSQSRSRSRSPARSGDPVRDDLGLRTCGAAVHAPPRFEARLLVGFQAGAACKSSDVEAPLLPGRDGRGPPVLAGWVDAPLRAPLELWSLRRR